MFHCFISLCFETMKHATWVFSELSEFREFRDNLLPMHCNTLNSLNSLNTLTTRGYIKGEYSCNITGILLYTHNHRENTPLHCGYTFIYPRLQGSTTTISRVYFYIPTTIGRILHSITGILLYTHSSEFRLISIISRKDSTLQHCGYIFIYPQLQG